MPGTSSNKINYYKILPTEVVIAAITACFLIWAIIFVIRFSFVALDNQRYFSLFDGAMISMRCAWNFSHGYGLVWNRSGVRIWRGTLS